MALHGNMDTEKKGCAHGAQSVFSVGELTKQDSKAQGGQVSLKASNDNLSTKRGGHRVAQDTGNGPDKEGAGHCSQPPGKRPAICDFGESRLASGLNA